MRKSLALALLLATTACTGGHPAYAYQVYPGCTAPTPVGTTWVVDPVNGKTPAAGGLGTAAAPWNSLQAIVGSAKTPGYPEPLLTSVAWDHYPVTNAVKQRVFADVATPGRVNPGDTILLMSGNYGDISIGTYATETLNSDWLTIKAAPGQTPVFTTLTMSSTNKWVFDGVKVQSFLGTNKNFKSLVTVQDGGALLPTKDIILANLIVNSADSMAGLTQPQWITQARNGVSINGSAGDGTTGGAFDTCVSVTGSHITNVRWGAVLTANQTLFSNNEIDHFGDDGIDYAANKLAITQNKIHDNLDVGDGNHEDGMQGQIGALAKGVAFNQFSDILIDSNVVIRQLDPALQWPTYLQGIDAFDSDWTRVTITNNLVITSSCYSIMHASIHDSLVANNTALEDGLVASPGCTASLIVGGKTHEGLDSSNTRVTNNLAEHYDFNDQTATNITFDHNVALNSYQPFVHWNGTAWTFRYPTGTDANGNVAFATPQYVNTFVNWSPATLTYDVRLKAGAVALTAGTPLNLTPSVGANTSN